LQETELSVSEVFQRLGYASAAAFNRAFKRKYRSPPSAYRRDLAGPSQWPAEALANHRLVGNHRYWLGWLGRAIDRRAVEVIDRFSEAQSRRVKAALDRRN